MVISIRRFDPSRLKPGSRRRRVPGRCLSRFVIVCDDAPTPVFVTCITAGSANGIPPVSVLPLAKHQA